MLDTRTVSVTRPAPGKTPARQHAAWHGDTDTRGEHGANGPRLMLQQSGRPTVAYRRLSSHCKRPHSDGCTPCTRRYCRFNTLEKSPGRVGAGLALPASLPASPASPAPWPLALLPAPWLVSCSPRARLPSCPAGAVLRVLFEGCRVSVLPTVASAGWREASISLKCIGSDNTRTQTKNEPFEKRANNSRTY